MSVKEIMMESKMILVCYDFSDNLERAKLRDELKGYPFYAKMMTESVYYLPDFDGKTLRAVRKWANQSSADIVVFGDVNTTLKDQKALVKGYYVHMQDIVKEVNDTAKSIRKQLLEFEQHIEDPESTLRGWATKVQSIRNRFEEIRSGINKVGDEDDEFELDKIAVFVDNLDKRYERVKEMKIRVNKENKKKK